MVLTRKPKKEELQLIQHIVESSGNSVSDYYNESLRVQDLGQGSMGSLTLFPFGEIGETRTFGKELGYIQYKDMDGVNVIATLYLDEYGKLYELDIWKTDYNNLISFSKHIDG